MANQNQCNFTGRIGNIETRYTQDDQPITNFSLAVNKSKKDKTESWIEETKWVRCIIFVKKADYVNKFSQNGYFIRILSNFKERKWTDKTGQKRTTSEFWVNEIEILGNRKEKSEGDSEFWGQKELNKTNVNQVQHTDFNDEIPF